MNRLLGCAAALFIALCGSPAFAAGGIGMQGSTAAASSLQLCTTQCDILDFHVTATSVAGYAILVDSASVPADGAITGVKACIYIDAAPKTVGFSSAGEPPIRVQSGAVLLFSTTGCYSKTASATAGIFGRAQ